MAMTTTTKPRSMRASSASPRSRYRPPQRRRRRNIGSFTTSKAMRKTLRFLDWGNSL
jgi:hypothetical protein